MVINRFVCQLIKMIVMLMMVMVVVMMTMTVVVVAVVVINRSVCQPTPKQPSPILGVGFRCLLFWHLWVCSSLCSVLELRFFVCLFVYHGLWLLIGCCTLSPSPVHAARGPSREEWGKLSLQIKQSWANNKNKDKTRQYIAALLGVNEQQPQFECRSRGSGHFNGCRSLALPAAYQWTISTRLGLGLYLVKNWEVFLPTRQIYIIDRPPTPIGASQRCIWDNSLPIGFYWPANGFLLCLNATWNQPIHEVGKFLGWDCGTWHITVQYLFVVSEVKQMIDLVGQLTMGNLAHDEGSLVTSPEGTSWVIWFGAMTVIGSRC